MTYLRGRGIGDHTIQAHGLGYQPNDAREGRAPWGLPAESQDAAHSAPKSIWLPRGIVIPWFIDGSLWRINIRRPITAREAAAGEPKYIGPAGFANGLYNAGSLAAEKPVLLVEGEIDALTAEQEAGDILSAVATGSTAGARRAAWVNRLAAAPCVLIAFDCDRNGAGEQAAAWWLQTLPNALRWRPLLHDVNAMHLRGVSVRKWVEAAIEHALQHQTTRTNGR